MIDLNNLHSHKQHEKIIQINSEDMNAYKAVAYIHLGKYTEALKYAAKDSYEAAYCHYKLKNFKKSLRIIKRNSGEKWDILESQVLYAMSYYKRAFAILSQYPKDDEIVVNLQAMKSLGILTEKVNKIPGHSLYIKKKEDEEMFEDLDNFRFKIIDNKMEFLYNKLFELADNKEVYLENLKKHSDEFGDVEDNIFLKQLMNVEGYFDEIDISKLLKTQSNILLYNMNKSNKLDSCQHFLVNYQEKMSDSEFRWVKHAKKNNWNIKWNEIPKTSENLKILRIFVGIKNKNLKREKLQKMLEEITNTEVRQVIEKYAYYDGIQANTINCNK